MSSYIVKPKNSNVKDKLSKEFKKDKDSNKFVKLWAAKLYLNITNIMRYVSPDEIISDYPYAFYFIHNLIDYFYKHGIYKRNLLENKIQFLYRGIDSRFTPDDTHLENSFMSTTWKLKVAETFAQTNGTVCVYPVGQLPDDIPFVVIDSKMGEQFREEEILFLPGTFHSILRDDLIPKFKTYILKHVRMTKYIPNRGLIQKYRSVEPRQIGGTKELHGTIKCQSLALRAKTVGTEESELAANPKSLALHGNTKSKYLDFYSYLSQLFEPFIDTISVLQSNGKYLILYRAVQGRPVEIIYYYNITDTESFFSERMKFYDDIHDNITNLMPEVQDIRNILKNNSTISTEDKHKHRDKLASYNISLALYNPVTMKVEDFNYGTFKFMEEELHIKNDRNDEIQEVIKAFMKSKEPVTLTEAEQKELEILKTLEFTG